MPEPVQAPRGVRFGSYTLDPSSGELHKNGSRIRLPEQPFQILQLLLQRPGEVVTREELRQRLWSGDTFVDFENGLNGAVKKLRDVLGDSAEKPRFVETIPRRGYRFIASVETLATTARPHAVWWRQLQVVAPLASAIVLVAVLFVSNVGGWRSPIFGGTRFKSVAVLPIKNLTGDPTQEDVADGMTDLLTTELAQINSLSVTSVVSAMHYKGTKKTLPEIARELHVDAVIEGSMQQAGNRMILTTQLVLATDRHLWARTFEPDFKDALAFRSQVARNIVGELNVKLTAADEARLQQVRTVNPEAQLDYMKGRNIWWRKLTEEGFRKSIAYYQTAIEKDPNFAEAYSGLAISYKGLNQLYPSMDIVAKSHTAALKAIELDPTLAEPHALLCWTDRNEAQCRKALDLSPNNAFAHLEYAAFLTDANRKEESLVEVRRAEQLDPMSAFISANVIMRLNMLGRFEESVQQGKKALELDPDFWLTYQLLGGAYLHLKKYDEAIGAWEKVVALRGGYETWALSRLVAVYMKVGRKDDARKAFVQLQQIAKERYVGALQLALGYAAMGRKEEAIAILQRAQRQGEGLGIGQVGELKRLLGDDPRFQKILKNEGFSTLQKSEAR